MRPTLSVSWDDTKRKALIQGIAIILSAVFAVSALTSAKASSSSTVGIGSFIVRVLPGEIDHVSQSIVGLGGAVTAHLRIIDALVVTISKGASRTLAKDPRVSAVTPNSRIRLLSEKPEVAEVSAVEPTLEVSTRTVSKSTAYAMSDVENITGASRFWKGGFTGAGVGVALIDSGVAPVDGLTSGKVINGPDLSFEGSSPALRYLDSYGHGTHMAGIIAGKDAKGFSGIAPDAKILNVKVAAANGSTDVSQVIAAIDWVVQHRADNGMNIRVMNLSFGTDSLQSYLLDPLSYAAEVAWMSGIVVVVAAGNSGNVGRLNDPAIDPYLIAVGASDPNRTPVHGDDTVPIWSSRGDGIRNPDVVAPGKSIIGLRVPGSYLDVRYPKARVATRFFKGSGTSQAAAVTSGAAALLVSKFPHITPDQVKRILRSSASKIDADARAAGRGEIDLKAAWDSGVPIHTQTWPRSSGTGSLDASRGTSFVSMDGVTLRGEVDIFGQEWDGPAWSLASASGSSWSGGTWNGTSWSGTSWSGTSWSGTSWSGTSWSGTSWSGTSWSGTSWSGTSWSSQAWCGEGWSAEVWG